MHKTISESLDMVAKLREALPSLPDRDALVCPPFTALRSVAEFLKGSVIAVGAQNMNDNSQGAFTGEVSPDMIREAGATHVILGHSERRQYYGENDALINKKAELALAKGLIPIVCVGETLAQREAAQTHAVVETQVAETLADLTPAQAVKTVIAYEPVWAIGTGKTATPLQAQEVHALIRGLLKKRFGEEAAASVRILYGGSIKPDNIDALMAEADIDGGLVGGASLKADDFLRLVRFQKK